MLFVIGQLAKSSATLGATIYTNALTPHGRVAGYPGPVDVRQRLVSFKLACLVKRFATLRAEIRLQASVYAYVGFEGGPQRKGHRTLGTLVYFGAVASQPVPSER